LNREDSQALLVATFNRGKVREIQQYFQRLPFRLLDLASLPGIQPSPEDGSSFEENACQKALYYSAQTEGLVLADDSGLAVDALNGEPGIHSGRYLRDSATDEERCRAILWRLRDVPKDRRSARFVCCVALAQHGGILQACHGIVEGRIGLELQGTNGFGYDPIFILPSLGKTLAELSPGEKLQISHRGQALQTMERYLRQALRDRPGESLR